MPDPERRAAAHNDPGRIPKNSANNITEIFQCSIQIVFLTLELPADTSMLKRHDRLSLYGQDITLID